MPTRSELIAACLPDEAAISAEIGADAVIYQDLNDLRDAITEEGHLVGTNLAVFESSCFDGQYVTSKVGEEYLSALASSRNAKRQKKLSASPSLGSLCNLHRLESSEPMRRMQE